MTVFSFTARALCMAMLLGLAACSSWHQNASGEDPTKVLEGMKSPIIPSVEKTLVDSADKAVKDGNFVLASQFYQQLADKHPENRLYTLSLAESLRRAGKQDASVRFYDKLLASNPRDVDALEGKGLAIMAKGEFVEAGKIFDRVLAIDPRRWRTLNAAGILFAMRHMTDEAVAYFEQALVVSPDNPSILNNVGLTLAMDKKYDKAITALQKAIAATSSEGMEKKRLSLNLALVYGISGHMKEAEDTAKPYLSAAALYNNLGYYAHLAKNDDLAKSYLNMALTKSPVYYERAWNNLEAIQKQAVPQPNVHRDLKDIGHKTHKEMPTPPATSRRSEIPLLAPHRARPSSPVCQGRRAR